jgi:hypothetical protein
MNLSLITSQRGLILAVVGIVLTEMTAGISASVASPTNASSMKLSGQEESVELAQQLSVSQMTKDKEEKTDKDDRMTMTRMTMMRMSRWHKSAVARMPSSRMFLKRLGLNHRNSELSK